jgi:hypothetical protein
VRAIALYAALPLAATLAACSYFSQTPDVDLVARIHREIAPGMTTDEAELKLGALDFSCGEQRGAYTDERGTDHENAHYLRCLRKPPRIGFACENRDQVIIVPSATGKVTSVDVIRGPDCQR